MRWFRLYDELLDDPKAQQLPPPLFKHWVNAMCLASQNKPRGTLPTIGDIAFRLRVSTQKATEIVGELVSAGLVEVDDEGVICIHNWGERQRASDDVAERVRRSRERASNGHVTLQPTLHETPLKLSRIKESETDTETDHHPPNPHTANVAAIDDDDEFSPTYETTLGNQWPKVEGRLAGISPEFTNGTIVGLFRDVERQVGPLPAAKLKDGIEAACLGLERKLEAEKSRGKAVEHLIPYASKVFVQRLKEAANAANR